MAKKLKAWIRKNHLTVDDPNDYTAVPVTNGSLGINEIVDELQKEGMELKRETVIDVINRFNRKVIDLLGMGYNINTGLVYIRLIIKGIFYGKVWNPEVNSIIASITQGAELRKALAETVVEILGEQAEPIEIFMLTDMTTGLTDGTLTKGRNAEIKGSYMKIAGDNPDCGISFTNTTTKEETRLENGDIVLNEPSRLLIFVPVSLASGEYELTVTTQYTKGTTLLKESRKATYSLPVIIA